MISDPARPRAALLLPPALALAAALAPPEARAQVVPVPGPGVERPDFDRSARAGIEETTGETQSSATQTVTTRLSDRINQALSIGLSALVRPPLGDDDEDDEEAATARRRSAQGADFGGGRLATWGSATVTSLDDEGPGREFDGTLVVPQVGLDYALPSGWVVGLAAGLERSDLETGFNDGRIDSLGFSVGPYAGVALGQVAILDAGVGYVSLDYDRSRQDGAFRGSFDADRIYAFANATGYAPTAWHGIEELSLRGRIGFRYSYEDQSGFTENGVRVPGGELELGQALVGAEARYYLPAEGVDTVELFARATGAYDAIREDRAATGFAAASDDRTDVTLAIGAFAVISDSLSADVTYESVLAREDLGEHSLTLGLRLNF